MENIYPPSPEPIPRQITKASSAYKLRAWMAMGGLSVFLSLYIGLSAWFAWTAWRMFSSIGQGSDFAWAGVAAGVAAAFLFVFMAKALFAVKHSAESRDVELKKDEHPGLFTFLYTLADEAGAPRPHKVYLSPEVNAAVFYDLSLLNLFFPSRKNLLIGLGLVNVLNLGELKAVLAHEFGHFAQRSMAVGRWVYVAQQIAGHIISERDALDKFLLSLSRIDIRIGWIGWILRLIIWSIRSLLDSVFSLVILSERALSRQMEFQADLVAVSLTGSDALVHALNKLHAGDDAWSRSLTFANGEVGEGRKVPDIFAVQSRILKKLCKIYNDDSYGKVPAIPTSSAEKHRVFTSNMASPPQMWSTHPENSAREENAKRIYISCAIDEREAWEVFSDAAAIRREVSEKLLASVETELADTGVEESLKHLDKFYAKTWLMPCYRGAYLGRSITRNVEKVADLHANVDAAVSEKDLQALYPETLSHHLENLRELVEEKNLLQALRDKFVKAAGGVINFRGQSIKRRDLPGVIAKVKKEISEVEQRVFSHDKQVRSLHMAIADKVGKGWKEYLQGLLAVLHYTDHCEANLLDVRAHVSNVWAVITADGRISEGETKRLIQAVAEAHSVMSTIFAHSGDVTLDDALKEKFAEASLIQALGEYNLPEPQRENINEWMNVFDGWAASFTYSMSSLKYAALESLLLSEAKIAGAFRQKKSLGDAPRAPMVPKDYTTLLPGKERQLQKKLDLWDSFFTATGFFPGLARFVVAVSLVGGVMWWGQSLGQMEVSVYNGLARTVNVDLNGHSARIGPYAHRTLSFSPSSQVKVKTTTDSGELIESFSQASSSASYQYNVYNVASAGPLVEWSAVYGSAHQAEDKYLGAPRWLTSSVDYYFSEPPEEIQIEGKGGTRSVLSGYGNLSPMRQMNFFSQPTEAQTLIRSHALWDDINSVYYMYWLAYLHGDDQVAGILQQRLSREPEATVLLRMEQDLAEDRQDDEVCKRQSALALKAPENASYQYLATRCMEDGPEQDKAFIEGLQRWQNSPWFAMGVGYIYARSGDWTQSAESYLVAIKHYRPLKAILSDTLVRLQRVSSFGDLPSMGELANLNDQLYYSLALENGEEFKDSYMYAYKHLQDGDLPQAMERAEADEQTQQRILVLAAASSGSQQGWREEALNIPAAELADESLVWASLALAKREGKSVQAYKDYLLTLDREYSQDLFNFLNTLDGGKYSDAENKYLASIRPLGRGYAFAMAAIYLQENCPGEWKALANKLLFVNERPFIAI